MVISEFGSDSADVEPGCPGCQHCVSVRGLTDFVCLAHLSVMHPTGDAVCADFEPKRRKAAAIATTGS